MAFYFSFFCKNIIDFFWFLWISPDFFHFSDFSGFLLISLDFSWFLKLCTWFFRVIYPSFKSSMNSYYDVSSIWGALKYRPMWLFHFFLNSFHYLNYFEADLSKSCFRWLMHLFRFCMKRSVNCRFFCSPFTHFLQWVRCA